MKWFFKHLNIKQFRLLRDRVLAPIPPRADMLQLLPCLSSLLNLDSTTLLCRLIVWPISWYRICNNLLKGSYCKIVLSKVRMQLLSVWNGIYTHRRWIHLCTPHLFTLLLTIKWTHRLIWYSQGFIFKCLFRMCGGPTFEKRETHHSQKLFYSFPPKIPVQSGLYKKDHCFHKQTHGKC